MIQKRKNDMGVLKNITNEYFGEGVRSGEGVKVRIGDRDYVLKFEYYDFAKDLVPVNEDGDLFTTIDVDYTYEGEVYMCKVTKDGPNDKEIDIYYTVVVDLLEELKDPIVPEGYIKRTVSVDIGDEYNPVEDGLFPIEILFRAIGEDKEDLIDFDDIFHVMKTDYGYWVDNMRSYSIYDSEDEATKMALEEILEYLEGEFGESMNSKEVERYRGLFGDGWIYTDMLEEAFKEGRTSYYNDIKDESGDHGCRLYDELIDSEVIEDTAEFFKTNRDEHLFEPEDYIDSLVSAISDETGENKDSVSDMVSQYDTDELVDKLVQYGIVSDDDEYFGLDYDEPKFNDDDKIHEAVDKEVNDDNFDSVDDFLTNFEELNRSYYNLDELAQKTLDEDGRANTLSGWDGVEYSCEIDDNTYLVYIN